MVRRQVLRSDYDELPPEHRDQESDGPTELIFRDGTEVHFVPDTEQMSVKVAEGRMPAWGEHYAAVEPMGNDFWLLRAGKPVSAVNVLVSDHANPGNRSEFGVEFQFEGEGRLFVEYVSDEAHTDTMRISGAAPVGRYRRESLV